MLPRMMNFYSSIVEISFPDTPFHFGWPMGLQAKAEPDENLLTLDLCLAPPADLAAASAL